VVAALFALLALLPLTMALGFWLHSWLNVSLAVAFLLAGAVYLLVTVIFGLVAMVSFKKLPKRDRGASVKQSVSVLSTVKPHARPKIADTRPTEGDKLQV
jgi:Ca2+/Na+ antiporter